jgi:chromosome partitioning protein
MATITFGGQKGGAGKTALTMHLGAEWLRRGRSVLLVDADPQAHVLKWHGIGVAKDQPVPGVVGVGDGLRAVVGPLSRQHDVTIVDTAGRHSRRLGGALAITDLVLLPAKPEPGDVWSLEDSIELVREVQHVRPDMRAAIVMCCTRATRIGKAARDAIAKAKIPVLGTSLRYFVTYSEAQAAGRGVSLYAPKSQAADELRALADELEGLLHVAA